MGLMSAEETVEHMKAELDYLRWFAINADFGPADSDVQAAMKQQYTEETGRPVPEGWRSE